MITLKAKFDERTRQFVQTVREAGEKKFRIFGDLESAMPMLELGRAGISTMRERIAKGVGSADQAMPPLKKGPNHKPGRKTYATYKAQRGLKPIRDLRGDGKQGGNMLDNISVRSVSAREVRIDLTSNIQRVKASANERRAQWWGWSPRDLAFLVATANKYFKAGVAQISGRLRGQRSFRKAA